MVPQVHLHIVERQALRLMDRGCPREPQRHIADATAHPYPFLGVPVGAVRQRAAILLGLLAILIVELVGRVLGAVLALYIPDSVRLAGALQQDIHTPCTHRYDMPSVAID